MFAPGRGHRVRAAVRGHGLAGVASRAGHARRRHHHHPPLGPQRPGPAAASPALARQRLPSHAARQRAAHAAAHHPHRARHRRRDHHAGGHPRHARLVLRHHGPQRGRAARRSPRPSVGRRSTASSLGGRPRAGRGGGRRQRRARSSRCSASGGTLSTPGHEDVDVLLEAIDLDSDAVGARRSSDGALGRDRSGPRDRPQGGRRPRGRRRRHRHPRAPGARRATGSPWSQTPIAVAGIHPSPFRFTAYVDRVPARRLRRAGRGQRALRAARRRRHPRRRGAGAVRPRRAWPRSSRSP